MPPTQSAPMRRPSSTRSAPDSPFEPSYEYMPSCGKLTIWMVTVSLSSSLSSSSALSEVRFGSVTSAWERMNCTPWSISFLMPILARRLTSSTVRSDLVSLQRWMPSNRVPVSLTAPDLRAVNT